MTDKNERDYIARKLMYELRADFDKWAKEYQQPRDLGALGEFVSLYRKARKLKTLMWPGENSHAEEKWREDQRTIVKEIVAHGLLLLLDLDREEGSYDKWTQQHGVDFDEDDEDLDDELPLKGTGPLKHAAKRSGIVPRQSPNTLIGGDNG